jgi:alpha-tubulin suppressor-like RCC1 family protein
MKQIHRPYFAWLAAGLCGVLLAGCPDDGGQNQQQTPPDADAGPTLDSGAPVDAQAADARDDADASVPLDLEAPSDTELDVPGDADAGDADPPDADGTDLRSDASSDASDAGDAADTTCTPRTCSQIQKACGRYSDRCGGAITCRSQCDDFLALGGYHTCFYDQNGQFSCWGWNEWGQLGLGSTGPDKSSPTQVSSPFTAPTSLTAGEDYTCLVDQGEALCWGANYHGQSLGSLELNGTDTDKVLSPTPTNTPGVGILSIEAHTGHTCAINNKQHLYCWGFNWPTANGVMESSFNETVTPTKYTLGTTDTVRRVSVGALHQCAESGRGDLWCFGNGFFGAIGHGKQPLNYVPPQVLPGFSVNFRQVEAGGMDTNKGGSSASFFDDFSCAIDSSGVAKCWGSDFRGSLGNGPPEAAENTPQLVQELGGDVVDLALGGGHACAIESGNLYCWGNNQWGQLGIGDTTDRLVATRVPFPNSSSPLQNVEAGYFHTCAQLRNNDLYCWGRNSNGQIGVGSRKTKFTTPQRVRP